MKTVEYSEIRAAFVLDRPQILHCKGYYTFQETESTATLHFEKSFVTVVALKQASWVLTIPGNEYHFHDVPCGLKGLKYNCTLLALDGTETSLLIGTMNSRSILQEQKRTCMHMIPGAQERPTTRTSLF